MSGLAEDPGTEMTLRFEIFPSDLDPVVDFYTRVLRFSVPKDQRDEPSAYVSMQRGAVRVGAGPDDNIRSTLAPAVRKAHGAA